MTQWLAGLGTQFAVFDRQDSGCVSYGVVGAGGRRRFVKTSVTQAGAASMERGLRFHGAVRHRPAIVAPLEISRFTDGRVGVIYPWVEGQVLYPASPRGRLIRTDPDGPWVRFRALPVERILPVIKMLLDVHVTVAKAGFVAVDLYDGCLLYDFDRHETRLVDLDEYRPGPFVLEADRLPGSTRFMAPEEFQRGAVIDERTMVFVLGRLARVLLDAGDDETAWRGTQSQLDVIGRATAKQAAARYATVEMLRESWLLSG